MAKEVETRPDGVGRRHLLAHGAKLAYVIPVILASAKAEPVFAGASGGGNNLGGNGHH